MKILFNLFKKKKSETNTNTELVIVNNLKEVVNDLTLENHRLKKDNLILQLEKEEMQQNINLLIDVIKEIHKTSINKKLNEINNEINKNILVYIEQHGINSFAMQQIIKIELGRHFNIQNYSYFINKLKTTNKQDLHNLFPNLKMDYFDKNLLELSDTFISNNKNNIKNLLIAFGNGIINEKIINNIEYSHSINKHFLELISDKGT